MFLNERTRSTPLDRKLTFGCISYYLVAFEMFGCLTKLGAKRAEVVQKFEPRSRFEIFETNAPDPPHWTLSWRFGAFPTILVHSGPFGCLTKLGAKRAEVVQKYVPRSRVRIFRNNSFDPPHYIINWCFDASRTIWVHSGPFGCLTKLGAKQADLVQKFVPRSRFGFFHNERTRSTPLDPKLMFWCISYYLGAFGTIWLPYETRCKTCRTSAKVRATKSRRNFSQRTHPIHPIAP